jgi:hypothetical protein
MSGVDFANCFRREKNECEMEGLSGFYVLTFKTETRLDWLKFSTTFHTVARLSTRCEYIFVPLSFCFTYLVIHFFIFCLFLTQANWAAVPASIPIVALSFVYQNVVPVISSELEGDLPKIRYETGLLFLAILEEEALSSTAAP